MNKETIKNIRKFIAEQNKHGKLLSNYRLLADPIKIFQDSGINVGLEENKEIILKEETYLELGGINKRSFSLIHPIFDMNLIEDGKITLLGPEIHQISDFNVDFGLLILIEVENLSKKEYHDIKSLNFISNGIEGFSIRTIPRKFWCRIGNKAYNKKFSFEFLGNAIIYLYRQKFKELIKKMEILIICSYPKTINEFIELSSDITNKFQEELKAKIDEWRKRIDCEYDWGCEICPYKEECYDIKQVLVERERIGK